MISLLLTALLTLQYPTYSQLPLKTEWESLGEDIEYELQYSYREDFKYIEISHWPTTNTYEYTNHLEERFYCRRLRYRYIGQEEYHYKNLDCFYFDSTYVPPPEDIPEEIPELPIPPEIPIEEETSIYNSDPGPIPSPLPPVIFDERDSLPIYSTVLGVSDSKEKKCKISILKRESYEILDWNCDLSLNINRSEYTNWSTYYSILVEGQYSKQILADVHIYECTPFNPFDIKTWGRCKLREIESKQRELLPIYSGYIQVDGKAQSNTSFIFKSNSFLVTTNMREDMSKKKVKFILNTYISLKSKEWIDVQYTAVKDLDLKEVKVEKKPFSFPLDRYIGVTQWYGCTKYQCPHKGIDFGARLNRVVSVSDGTVVNSGYDRYGGECNQGGNFVILKHTNGMYSTYFHLDSYSVRVGDTVKKGQTIGITGNSGKWNCQNLGYHLHFETRKSSSSSTHSDPVKYIDIDWNMIPTLGKEIYPNRLSGENPHPNF
ncbi:MAG: M23 family metallopeptidase [Candidatus Dojkabacteria bacterium]